MVNLTEETEDRTAREVVASKEVKGVGSSGEPGDDQQNAHPGEGVEEHVYHGKEAGVGHPGYYLNVSGRDGTDGSQ